jgi:hypothetical protein
LSRYYGFEWVTSKTQVSGDALGIPVSDSRICIHLGKMIEQVKDNLRVSSSLPKIQSTEENNECFENNRGDALVASIARNHPYMNCLTRKCSSIMTWIILFIQGVWKTSKGTIS